MKPRYAIAVALILAGTNLLTLGLAYRGGIKHTLPRAVDRVERFLASRSLWWNPDNKDVVALDLPPKACAEVRDFLAELHDAGGEAYAREEVLPVLGLGGILVAAGLLVPFYRRGSLARIDEEQKSRAVKDPTQSP